MEVYVKESLHVLDYQDQIVDSIFISDDHTTPGYAYEINVVEANTGYSDLSFNMPNTIINDKGESEKNPRLGLLTPLVKLRYHRQVFYKGEETIVVREPEGYGDTVTYVDKEYSNAYPNNIIENYIMDYIVQPVDKKREGVGISTKFTAIDYPRFNLSKKKVGLTIATDTVTKEEWSLFTDKPMDVAGTIKYVEWDSNLAQKAGTSNISNEWSPVNAEDYPLTKDQITKLMDSTSEWPYGLLATAFYWRIKGTSRYEGQLYKDGSFLVLHLYDFYSLSDDKVDPDRHIRYKNASDQEILHYGYDWTQLHPSDNYLCPNKADNYLSHILEGTNWDVGYVEIVTKDIPKPNAEDPKVEQKTESAPMTCNISVSNGNCYNAITAVCQGLQLYPIFDCIKRTVSLRAFAGKNHGLVYRLGSNLTSNNVKTDGDKVITKLYVNGGKDYNGDANINIGDATRSFEDKGNPDDEKLWNPNDPRYIIKRSPYGTNYIYNFKWMFDNGWMTKDQITGLYEISQKINDENKKFIGPYTEDRLRTLQEYNDAVNNYDLSQGEYQSILNSMMNKYYKKYGQYSEGMLYAFHKAPLGLHEKNGKNYLWIRHCYKCGKTESVEGAKQPDLVCSACGASNKDLPEDQLPLVQVDELYIPVYNDYRESITPPPAPEYPYGTPDGKYQDVAYEPYIKGDYLKLVGTLDRYTDDYPEDPEKDSFDIGYYEGKVYITRPIDMTGEDSIDGYDYIMNNVYLRASSGHIEEWNNDIDATKATSFIYHYGKMLTNLRIVNECQEKLDKLQERYDTWKAEDDRLHALIQDAYGDYIVEGTYTNSEQPYVGLLFREGMEASDKFAVPEVTYTLDVVDSSGLVEYRQPNVTKYACNLCHHTVIYPITVCPRCGHTGIEQYEDTYNDLVHTLHSVGQIIPKAGDYVTVYDEPIGMFGVPALITEISRTLDNPINNKIKLDTSYTDDEELVGNIITATNTVLSNADIYARTAVLKADGTIDSASLSQSLNDPNANISIVGTNGNMLLTGSALQFTDPADSSRAMKYTGTGIFSTTTLEENNEGTLWTKMITPDGINANYINAGAIDTQQITIMSGLTAKVIMDEYGLAIKDRSSVSHHLKPFDKTEALTDADYASNWGKENNLAGFVGVDKQKNPLIYTKGFLVAEEGSNIANWITSKDGFYHLNDKSKQDLWLSPTGLKGTVNGKEKQFALYANGNFGVETNGILHATGANISGKIVVTDSSSTMNTGTVGGWEATDTMLKVTGIELSPTGGTEHTVNDTTSKKWAIWANNNFGVTTEGKLYATGADIKGKIVATSGEIGGCTIANGTLQIKNANIDTLSISKVTGGSNSESITFSGSITCDNFTAKKDGTIAGWKINSSKLGTDDVYLDPNGNFGFYNLHRVVAASSGQVTLNSQGGKGIIMCDGMTSPTDGNVTVAASDASKVRLVSTTNGIQLRVPNKKGISIGTSDDDAVNLYTGTIKEVDIAYGDPIDLTFINGFLVSYAPSKK